MKQFFLELINKFRHKFCLFKTKYWYRYFFKLYGGSNLIMNPMFITFDVIEIYNSVSIWPNARIEGVKKYQSQCFSPRIVLLDNVSIQQNIHLTCASYIHIGKNTAIAANVTITDINHPYKDIVLPIEQQPIEVSFVIIGDDCKIYNNAVILPGTNIGKHCTVGANSVVRGQFPDFCVIVGAPARIVKRYSFEKELWLKTDNFGNFI